MKEIILVKCVESDCEFIYKLANDQKCRENSFNSNFIDYETHKKWFASSMKNYNRRIYIVKCGELSIGEIRIDIIDDECGEISYSIEEAYRDKGIGTKVLGLIKEIVIKEMKMISVLRGRVRKENIQSRKVFLKNGYSESLENNVYEYNLKIQR